MIPATWAPYYRLDDSEVLGYLVPADGEAVVPVTLLGSPLGPPMEVFAAEQTFEELGLAYLAEPWLLLRDDGTELRVLLVEVDANRVVVADADYAQLSGARDIGERTELELPTDRLRPA